MRSDHWFEWEREGAIHPLLMCMEAWMEPMKNAYGRPWPPTILIFNGDIVSWYNPWPQLLADGDFFIKRFSKPTELNELKDAIQTLAMELERLFSRFNALDFSKLSDKDLMATYEELHSRYIQWFVPGGLVEPVGHQGEMLVKKMVSDITLLTTTTQDSFSKTELRDLLIIAVSKIQGKDVTALLEAHAKKYFWLHNGYFSTEVLDGEFFEKELELALRKYPNPMKQLRKLNNEPAETRAKKDALIKELGLDENGKNLVALLDFFAWYQDYRKEYVMKMLHYLDRILEEIGRRRGFSLKEMKSTLPAEIPKIMQGAFDKRIVEKRMKRYLFYFDGTHFEDGTGEWSLKKESEIFHSFKHENEVLEVSGMVASKGFVRGRARVTMSAAEAKSIQPGEILITSMTTPDFVTSIKRAAAIVTNEGGILCHAAVISREFGIPCIVGTKIATKIFKTGDLIEADGELGVVRKIST